MSRESLSFLLIQARKLDDPVRGEEFDAFALRAGVPRERIKVVDMTRDSLTMALTEGIDAVLVGGAGQYSVLDDDDGIRGGIDFLGELADRGFPTFASCFGFQALVLALGGEVICDEDNAEVGTFEVSLTAEGRADPVFGELPERFQAQEGHKDRATVMPEGTVNLARSPLAPFQALRVEGKPVYATQFHPELDQASQKLRFARYMPEYGRLFGQEEAQRIMDGIAPSPATHGLLDVFVRRILLGETS